MRDAEVFRNESVEALAEHEFIIGNWYFDHSLFAQAIHRYTYVMKQYPNYKGWEEVVENLIEAYRKNQQPNLADELARVLDIKKAELTASL